MAGPLAILGALAPFAGAAVSAFGAHKQNQAAQAASREQMAFQKKTLKSQYQWATQDMRKAGINPMLAYQQGGAGSAGGSSYTPANVGAAASSGFSQGAKAGLDAETAKLQKTQARLAAERQRADLDQLEQATALGKAQERTQSFIQAREAAQAGLASAQRLQALEGVLNTAADTRIKVENLASARAAAAAARSDEEFFESDMGEFLRFIDRAGSSLNPMTRSTSNIAR